MKMRIMTGGVVRLTLTASEAAKAGIVLAPAKVAPAKVAKPKTIASKAEIAAGGGFPCTLGCTFVGRTAARATSHAADNAALKLGGHIARP